MPRRKAPKQIDALIACMLRAYPKERTQVAGESLGRLQPFCTEKLMPAWLAQQDLCNPNSGLAGGNVRRYPGILLVTAGLLISMWALEFGRLGNALGQSPIAGVGEAQASSVVTKEALVAAIEELKGHEILKPKLIEAVNAKPTASKWLVELGDGRRAAMQLERFPGGSSLVHLPPRIRVLKVRALMELVRAEATLDLLARIGLDDVGAIEDTIEKLHENNAVAGHVHPEILTAVRHDEVVIGIAVAPRSAIQASLMSPPGSDMLQGIYRQSLVDRYQAAVGADQYQAALKDIRHLMTKSFVAPDEFLAASQCYAKLGNTNDAAETLSNLLIIDDSRIDADFLIEVGDRFFELKVLDSESLAEQAYTKALAKLQSR